MPTEPPLRQPYTIKDVARRVKCDEHTARAILVRSQLPCFRTGPNNTGQIRVDADAFEQWLATESRPLS